MKLIILINTLEKLETEKSIILTKTAGTNNLQYIIRQISEAPGNLASVGTENRTKTRTKTRRAMWLTRQWLLSLRVTERPRAVSLQHFSLFCIRHRHPGAHHTQKFLTQLLFRFSQLPKHMHSPASPAGSAGQPQVAKLQLSYEGATQPSVRVLPAPVLAELLSPASCTTVLVH